MYYIKDFTLYKFYIKLVRMRLSALSFELYKRDEQIMSLCPYVSRKTTFLSPCLSF